MSTQIRRTVHSESPHKPRSVTRNLSRVSAGLNSWKIGKYWDNSGTQNPSFHKNHSEIKLNEAKTLSTESQNSNRTNTNNAHSKHYSSNSESREGWDVKISKNSMINYQNRDYNLITSAVNPYRPQSVTKNKQKIFSDFVDVSVRKNNKMLNPSYQEALQNNPKIFHRRRGEFTTHQDSCVKLSGNGPFFRLIN